MTIIQQNQQADFKLLAFSLKISVSEIRKILNLLNFPIYIFVGENGIADILQAEFNACTASATEAAKIINGAFYWKVEKGNTLDSTFGKILGKKSLKDQFTSRNANTFEKIIQKF